MSVFLLFASLVGLAVAYVLYQKLDSTRPLEILDVSYDVALNRLEMTVENKRDSPYHVISALRLDHSGREDDISSQARSSDPLMMRGSVQAPSIGGRYTLLGEDDEAAPIPPGQTRTFTYIVPEFIDLQDSDDIKVDMFYGSHESNIQSHDEKWKVKVYETEVFPPPQAQAEDGSQPDSENASKDFLGLLEKIEDELEKKDVHPFLKCVSPEHSFKLKVGHADVIEDIFFLHDLLRALKEVPAEAIQFHLEGRNDFASWVRDVVGDNELSDKLEEINFNDSEKTRKKLIKTLQKRIDELEESMESIGQAS